MHHRTHVGEAKTAVAESVDERGVVDADEVEDNGSDRLQSTDRSCRKA